MMKRIFLILIFPLLLVACDKHVLYSQLTESEANEMVARLYASNVSAEKIAETDGTFRVDTDKSSFSRAVAVLQAHGLPRERFQSLGEIFEKDGFVSSPLEERARLNYALSQEISRTISNIDGVILARVHLAVPKREHLAKTVEPSSASVFVKHRASVNLADSVGKIKSMVVTGFENLPYENVTVSLFSADTGTTVSEPVDGVIMDTFSAATKPSATSNFVIILCFLVGLFLLVLGGISLYRTRSPAPVKARRRV